MDIRVFYHICAMGPWKEIVEDQMEQLVESGLCAAAHSIRCYVLGSPASVAACQALLSSFGEKVIIQATNSVDKLDEYFTVSDIANHIAPESKVLYLHSKGVTRFGTDTYRLGDKEIAVPNLYSNVTDWRHMMEFFLIYQWKVCVRELDTHDAVGVNYVRWPSKTWGHFSGNFWWCTGKYFLTLAERVWSPEVHVGRNDPKVKELFNSGLAGHGHYLHSYPKTKYVDKVLI